MSDSFWMSGSSEYGQEQTNNRFPNRNYNNSNGGMNNRYGMNNSDMSQSDLTSQIVSAVLNSDIMRNTISQIGQSNRNGNDNFDDRRSRSSRYSPSRRSPGRRFSRHSGGRSPPRRYRSPPSRRGGSTRFSGNRSGPPFKRHRSSRSPPDLPTSFSKRRRGRSPIAPVPRRYLRGNDETAQKLIPDEEVPLESLYCHMCRLGSFKSIQTYLYHLDGVRHQKTAQAYHEHCESILTYLRNQAKVANIRFGIVDKTTRPWMCRFCMSVVKVKPNKHRKFPEHKAVMKFLNSTCCGVTFETKYRMDEHKLSIPHLKTVFEAKHEKDLFEENCLSKENSDCTLEEAIEHLKRTNPNPEVDYENEKLAKYDGESFVGIDFLAPRDGLLCGPCGALIPIGVKHLEGHMLSVDHYENIVTHLKKKRSDELRAAKEATSDDLAGTFEEIGEDVTLNRSGRRTHGDDDDDDDDIDDLDDEGDMVVLSGDESEHGDAPDVLQGEAAVEDKDEPTEAEIAPSSEFVSEPDNSVVNEEEQSEVPEEQNE